MNNYLILKQKRSRFTKNEREVINALLSDAKTPDIKIAEKLKITTQAVGKIRKKLETEGVIKGYCAKIDYRKVGIGIFCHVHLYVDPHMWRVDSERMKKKIIEAPYIIDAYQIVGNEAKLILLFGFKDVSEMEGYFKSIQDCVEEVKILEMQSFSTECVLKRDSCGLIKEVINNPDGVSKVNFTPTPKK